MALRDGWNFHNDIALRLENVAKRELGIVGTPSHTGAIYDADSIEAGGFVDLMFFLLNKHYNNDDQYTREFEDACTPYKDQNGNAIPPETAQMLLNEFLFLIGD